MLHSKFYNRKNLKFDNFLILKKNFISFIFFISFCIPFFFGVIWQFRTNNPFISELPFIDYSANLTNSDASIFFKYLPSLSFLITPILMITILEMFRSKGNFKNRFFFTSLGRINFSKGYKFADIWYFVLEYVFGKFSKILTFVTLGFAVLNSKLSSWFSNLYSSILHIPSSQVISLIIFLISVLTIDLLVYVKHRLSHEIPFFWDLHELHHSPTEMTILSEERNTPFDNIFFNIIFLPFEIFHFLLIAHYLKEGFILPLIIYILFSTLQQISTMVGHSSFKLVPT